MKVLDGRLAVVGEEIVKRVGLDRTNDVLHSGEIVHEFSDEALIFGRVVNFDVVSKLVLILLLDGFLGLGDLEEETPLLFFGPS